MSDVALLIAGMALAAVGGEVFVRGAVGIASGLRVPIGMVGVTVAAFATSAPEMAVGVNAAIAGVPQVAAGNALGGNVVNIALVMGTLLVVSPLTLNRRDVRRDLPLTIAAPLVLGLLTLDGWLSRIDGAVLVTVFVAWFGTTIRQAIGERSGTARRPEDARTGMAPWLLVAGIALLLGAGRLVVVAAEGIGRTFELHPFIVGATVVALGTSMPEFATAVVSRLRRHSDLGAGTVMGSIIFNSLLIVGSVALIRPFSLQIDTIVVAIAAGVTGGLLLIPSRSWTLSRRRGLLLVGGYAVYLAALVAVSG